VLRAESSIEQSRVLVHRLTCLRESSLQI